MQTVIRMFLPSQGAVGVARKPCSSSDLSSPACFTRRRRSRNVAVTCLSLSTSHLTEALK